MKTNLSDQNLLGLFKRSSHISPTKLLLHSVTSNEHIFSHSHFQRILPSSVTSLNNSRGHKIHLAKKSSNRTTSHSLPVQFEFNSLFLTDIFHKVLNPFAVNRYLLFWSLPVNSPYGVRRKEYILAKARVQKDGKCFFVSDAFVAVVQLRIWSFRRLNEKCVYSWPTVILWSSTRLLWFYRGRKFIVILNSN